jgi:hypothetical protein
MEKGQTTDDVSHFLKSAYESKVFYIANYIPGYPKENYMDFILQLKFLYENRTYFGNNGLLNLMQSTDILNHTPLDIHREDFDVSKEKTMLNSWVSKDYKNMLMIRHLRSFLTEVMLKSFKFTKEGEDTPGEDWSSAKTKEKGGKPPYYRARMRKKDLQFIKTEADLKDTIDDSVFSKDFLFPNEEHTFLDIYKNNITDTIKKEINKTIKGFAWLMVNISNKCNINFRVRDDFKGYNARNSYFNLNFNLESQGDNFELDFDFDFKVAKGNKKLFDETDNLDFGTKSKFHIKDNINKYNFSEEVNELYLDGIDYEKHKVNYKRVPLTNQY